MCVYNTYIERARERMRQVRTEAGRLADESRQGEYTQGRLKAKETETVTGKQTDRRDR